VWGGCEEGVLAPPWGGVEQTWNRPVVIVGEATVVVARAGSVLTRLPRKNVSGREPPPLAPLSPTLFRRGEESRPSEAKARGCRGPIHRAQGEGTFIGMTFEERYGQLFDDLKKGLI